MLFLAEWWKIFEYENRKQEEDQGMLILRPHWILLMVENVEIIATL
jgi:hypothetical protein